MIKRSETYLVYSLRTVIVVVVVVVVRGFRRIHIFVVIYENCVICICKFSLQAVFSRRYPKHPNTTPKSPHNTSNPLLSPRTPSCETATRTKVNLSEARP